MNYFVFIINFITHRVSDHGTEVISGLWKWLCRHDIFPGEGTLSHTWESHLWQGIPELVTFTCPRYVIPGVSVLQSAGDKIQYNDSKWCQKWDMCMFYIKSGVRSGKWVCFTSQMVAEMCHRCRCQIPKKNKYTYHILEHHKNPM